jgi:hypothetical protein
MKVNYTVHMTRDLRSQNLKINFKRPHFSNFFKKEKKLSLQSPAIPTSKCGHGHRRPIAVPCRKRRKAAPHPAAGGVGGEPHRGGRGDTAAVVGGEGTHREQPRRWRLHRLRHCQGWRAQAHTGLRRRTRHTGTLDKP